MAKHLTILGRVDETPSGRRIPLFLTGVPAGFPSPADDYIDCHLDLHEHLIEHPAATFYVRASGNSMVQAGIHDGDLLIVDRAVEPHDGHIVIAVVLGELTVKRLRQRQGRPPGVMSEECGVMSEECGVMSEKRGAAGRATHH